MSVQPKPGYSFAADLTVERLELKLSILEV
jgi:hypothetical protein